MKIKELALGTLSRILRYAGILLLIYISMVFYLALTERRNGSTDDILMVRREAQVPELVIPVTASIIAYV